MLFLNPSYANHLRRGVVGLTLEKPVIVCAVTNGNAKVSVGRISFLVDCWKRWRIFKM